MFVDVAKITVKAGDGGDGHASFFRDAMTTTGGPDGGDGGVGGNVVLRADSNLSTLMDFRYKRKFEAKNGENGGRRNRSGANGEDIVVKVPVGTVISISDEQLAISNYSVADLSEHGSEFVIAKGGKGGWGNAHFATPTRQAPSFYKSGQKGEEWEITLELKSMADVGLIGMPSAGKSTLLSSISNAKPKIGDYPFTTLFPNLGVACVSGESFTAADIPGLIEGASEGAGLGHDFLRHIERTRILVHLVDISPFAAENPEDAYEKINLELASFSENLAKKEQILVLNKCDIADDDLDLGWIEGKYFTISAATRQGVDELLHYLLERVKATPKEQIEIFDMPQPKDPREISIERDSDGAFRVIGVNIEDLANKTDVDDTEQLAYLQKVLRDKGVYSMLADNGMKSGDTVRIGYHEFENE